MGCVLAALTLSACGSTVSGSNAVSTGPGTNEFGTGQATQTGALGSTTSAGGATGSQSTTSGGNSGTGSFSSDPGATTSTNTSTSGATLPPTGVKARGVTATTLTVGVPVPTDTNAVANSFGIKGAGSVSPQDILAAVVNDVNKSGGILGRKLVAYQHTYNLASYISNPSQVDSEICADFRDDHKVFAVLYNMPSPDIRSCTAKMGAPLIVLDGLLAYMQESLYKENGANYLFAPTSITAERLAQLFIKSLMARTFTQKWNITAGGPGVTPMRLGLIHADTPDQNALYALYAKELAKYGLKFTDTATYTPNVQAGLAATQSAVLKFRSDGITHVFGASAFFLQDAENQHYRPRYAYLPGLGAIGVANSPSAQLNGALTVGWAPSSDVASAQDPGDTPGSKHCRAVMSAVGLGTTNRADLEIMYSVCDTIYSLRTALTNSREASVSGIRRGYESLGSSFPTSLTFNAVLGPDRHYGIDSVRDMAYDTSCSCLKYTSKTNRS